MAQFPNAVVSFATKNPGDVIPSADWNSQNAEIVAIEDGYLNGTARLNSSASTLATLSVTGGSTLTTLTVTGALTASLNAPYCKLTNSVKTDLANNTWTSPNWDTDQIDTSNLHSTSVNSSRITFGSTGAWLVGGSVTFVQNSSNYRHARILINDTNAICYIAVPGVANNPTPITIAALAYATSTSDYATFVILQDSGSTCSLTAHTGGIPCTFWAQRVSV